MTQEEAHQIYPFNTFIEKCLEIRDKYQMSYELLTQLQNNLLIELNYFLGAKGITFRNYICAGTDVLSMFGLVIENREDPFDITVSMPWPGTFPGVFSIRFDWDLEHKKIGRIIA
jgi:hypothetical protein